MVSDMAKERLGLIARVVGGCCILLIASMLLHFINLNLLPSSVVLGRLK